MKLRVHVTTASGRIYHIQERDGQTLVSYGFWDAEVIKLHQAIKLGNELEITLIKINPYGVKETIPTYMKTDRIVDLEVL